MSGKAVGRLAAALPWLCPNTDELIRLAESPASYARPCAPAPAILAFLLRYTPPAAAPQTGLFCPAALALAGLPEAAAAFLTASRDGWVAPTGEVAKRCRALILSAARFARRAAEHTHRACPDRAAAIATLAPLGWLAVAAVDHGVAAEPLHDPDKPPVAAVQADVWGLDQNAIARRLAHRWRLPDWIASALGNMSLPLAAARAVVPDTDLFSVAQLAVIEAERRTHSLGLSTGVDRGTVLAELDLDDALADELWTLSAEEPAANPAALDPDPHSVPLVANLLKMAGESRRRNGAALVVRLENRMDDLHRAVVRVGAEGDDRARDAKLAALAELAAGAGHEINNPLAVISGHAQRLFRSEPDPERGESLQTIIRQSQRIAGIVRDLMQFARPPQPKPQRVAATDLLSAVRTDLAQFAAERGVQLDLDPAAIAAFVRCDQLQIKHALVAVARNGIEAAGRDGFVRLSCLDGPDELVEFVVEDSGPGLTPAALVHCFDPFYCGRSAGRGRGLGLPTAWQLARQNGGDLRHDSKSDGPTRFVLSVPRSVTLDFLDRQSA
jgi:signal transduction histidine kinase